MWPSWLGSAKQKVLGSIIRQEHVWIVGSIPQSVREHVKGNRSMFLSHNDVGHVGLLSLPSALSKIE